MKRFILLTLCWVCLSNLHSLQAQMLASNVGAFDSAKTLEEELRKDESSTAKIPEYYRHFRKLSETYKGFLIRLTVSDLPLRRDYHLFKYFGNVHYELMDTGQYAYYIKINFNKKNKVEKFLNDIVIHSAPEAAIVQKKGLK